MRRLLSAAVVAVLTAVLLPGTAHASGGRSGSTWLPYWAMDAAYPRVVDNADLFGTVSPFWYRASSCSDVVGNPGAGDPSVVTGLRERDVSVVPTVTSPMPPAVAVACFADDASRGAHVTRLLEVAGGYDGLEFNYEHLAVTTDPGVAAQVREAYTRFARDVCAALHDAGKRCVHTVMPRTDDGWSVWRGKLTPAVYDYRALGEVADLVRVMAYDQHAPGTSPGPIAGWPWVAAIAAYSAQTLPSGKGELGIPLYGRDWGGGRVATVSAPSAVALAQQHGVAVQWDETQHAPSFSYTAGGARHTVWFSDTRSVLERVGLARAHGLGAAYWVPSQEDAVTWAHVRSVLQARFWDVVGGDLQQGVEAVAARDVATGYADGSFRPALAVPRGQMATFLTRALGLPLPEHPAPFSDVANSAHRDAIGSVHEAGIAGGWPDGTFRPDLAVTRGQMATFLSRAFGLDPCEDPPFTDVADSPHRTAVCAVARSGVAGGWPDGTYRPDAPVTRGQMALLLARVLGLVP